MTSVANGEAGPSAAVDSALASSAAALDSSSAAATASNGVADKSDEADGDEDDDGGEDGDDGDDDDGEETPLDSLSKDQLVEEVQRARTQRDGFEEQYRGLLAKLTQMRTTLGDRLRQDAEELDRRETQIDNLSNVVDTLKEELLTSHSDVERLTTELDAVRKDLTKTSAEAAAVSASLAAMENEAKKSSESTNGTSVRELQETAERLRLEAEGWESACLEERASKEELEGRLELAKAEKEEAERREDEWRARCENEAESARGLQMVLEEFQAGQEQELQRALGDYQERYDKALASLDDAKERAEAAEAQLLQFRDDAERCQSLEKEVKEKTLLVGKLRHEAVILNEHLTEALRRLRTDSSDSNVDRRLVSNLFLQFVSAPRGDAKKFEMLSLIASVLSWTDDEREAAGLQRSGAGSSSSAGGTAGRGGTAGKRGHARTAANTSGATGNEESFSNLFVEFLLRESSGGASSGTGPTSPSGEGPNAKGPGSGGGAGASQSTPTSPRIAPSRPSFNLGSLAGLRRGGGGGEQQKQGNGGSGSSRAPSFSSLARDGDVGPMSPR